MDIKTLFHIFLKEIRFRQQDATHNAMEIDLYLDEIYVACYEKFGLISMVEMGKLLRKLIEEYGLVEYRTNELSHIKYGLSNKGMQYVNRLRAKLGA